MIATSPVRTLIVDDEPVARAYLRSLLDGRDDVQVVGEPADGRAAVTAIREQEPELVLLDIQMPELSGFEVIREVGPERMPAVVFVTAYDEHALAAFELHALDYILKPVDRQRFADAITRAARLARLEPAPERAGRLRAALDLGADAMHNDEQLAIRSEGRVVLLRLAEIDWIEAADDHVRFHVGGTVYRHRDTLTRLEQRLPATHFLRIHRSTIVNLDRIREMQPWFQSDWVIILADGTRLHSGRRYREAIRSYLQWSR